MKKPIYHIIFQLLAVLLLTTSCLGGIENAPQGWLQVGRPSTDLTTASRAADTEEIDYRISILRGNDIVMYPTRYSSFSGRIPLSASTSYTLLAESCSESEAEKRPTSYGQPRYAGSEPFVIVANESTSVTVNCSMANAAFCIRKDESFYYTQFTVSATVNGRTLYFTDEDRMGYFNVGEDGTATLHYEVEAIDASGLIGRGSGTLQLKKRNLSKLWLKATPQGGVDVSIKYDDTFTPVVTNIEITE
jgi:hypothetical protein